MTAHDKYTLGYRSASVFPPELICDSAVPCPQGFAREEKIDVWALGCVAFTLAVGHEPFDGATETALFESIKMRDNVHIIPAAARSKYGEPFCEMVGACLRKDPSARLSMMGVVRHKYLSDITKSTTLSSSCSRSTSCRRVTIPTTTTEDGRCLKPSSDEHILSANCGAAPSDLAKSPFLADVYVIQGLMQCSSCKQVAEKSFTACRDCDSFAVCQKCSDRDVSHNPAHRLMSYVLHEAPEPALLTSLVCTPLARSSCERQQLATENWMAAVQAHHQAPWHKSSAGRCGSLKAPSPLSAAGGNRIDAVDECNSSLNMAAFPPLIDRNASFAVPTQFLTVEEETILSMGGKLPCRLAQMRHNCANNITAAAPDVYVDECLLKKSAEVNLHAMGMLAVPQQLMAPHGSEHVTSLDLSMNNLEVLPNDFHFLCNLEELCVCGNKLRSLPSTIGDLAALRKLNASSNLLEDLPQELMFAESLNYISVDFNRMTRIPEVVFDMPALSTFYIAGNDISEWPPIELLQQCTRPMELGIDNDPALCKKYLQEIGEKMMLRVVWNKVYPDAVLPGLYLGSVRTVQQARVYEKLSVTHILTVGRGLEPLVPPGMHNLVINVDDLEGASIDHVFASSFNFIDEALGAGGCCIVHCFAGLSRSASTVIAYLMARRGMRLDEAYLLVKRSRPAIHPNKGFFEQLVQMDRQMNPNGRELDVASLHREDD